MRLRRGERAAELRGPHAAVLTAERTLLNFLSRLSGVATLTAKFVRAARAANPRVQILDTRKTLPGWRELDKYAVALGGGTNHRFGLHDAVLIKDNHLAGVTTDRLAEHVRELLATLAQLASRPTFIEIEVDSLEQLDAVLPVSEIDYVLLDNFSPEELTEAVRRRDALCSDRKPELEASGNVTLATIAEVAVSGVDRISIGSLTHSVPAFDWGLDL
jgi:nicotinate-nucleotide pyrophosphorylase (carboxylating)